MGVPIYKLDKIEGNCLREGYNKFLGGQNVP